MLESSMVAEKTEGVNAHAESDKRYLPRWRVANRVTYQLENENKLHESNSLDISCTGACFSSAGQLPVNKKVKMKIYLSEDSVVNVEGQIVWNKPIEAHNLVGVIFSNTSQKVQDLILKHAFEIKKEDMIKYWFQ